jgi:FIMAH domain-containing protein
VTTVIARVNGLQDVKSATKNALVVKLNAAQKALSQGKVAPTCSNLQDFINRVMAQAGKKELTTDQANSLIAEAQRIRAVIGCP